jgi:thiamine transport system permease protein
MPGVKQLRRSQSVDRWGRAYGDSTVTTPAALPPPLRAVRLRVVRFLFVAVPLGFLLLFFFWPLANIFRRSLSFAALGALIARPAVLETVWFTAWQATLSTAITLIAGLPAAYLFARYAFPGKSLLRALITVPFVMPTVVVAAAFRALLGPAGPLNRLLMGVWGLPEPPLALEQSLTIILVAHVFYNVAVVVRLVGGFWANLSPRLGEAAAMLGASRWRTFRHITLPLLRPPLLGATLLVYLFTFTSFGVILLLGGPQFSTIETEIYRQYVTFLRPDIAAILALLQMVFTFVLMSAYARWQQRATVAVELRPQSATARAPRSRAERGAVLALLVGMSLFLLAPLVTLMWRSLSGPDGGFSLAFYEALPVSRRGSTLFIAPLEAVRNSLGYALLTMLGAGILGLMGATLLRTPTRWRRWLEPIFMLPLGASAVTLGFGYVLTLRGLRTSPLLVLIAHVLVAFPFVVRTLLPALQAIRPGLREAAAVMGAEPWRVWREIDLPIVGRALLVGVVFAFTVSMGEFGATSFIVRPNSGYLTLPIAIQRFLGQPGAANYGQALALSTILMLVCAAGFVAIERFRYADIGEF